MRIEVLFCSVVAFNDEKNAYIFVIIGLCVYCDESRTRSGLSHDWCILLRLTKRSNRHPRRFLDSITITYILHRQISQTNPSSNAPRINISVKKMVGNRNPFFARSGLG